MGFEVFFWLFTRRQQALWGCLHTHMATARECEKLVKHVFHRLQLSCQRDLSLDFIYGLVYS